MYPQAKKTVSQVELLIENIGKLDPDSMQRIDRDLLSLDIKSMIDKLNGIRSNLKYVQVTSENADGFLEASYAQRR